MNLHDRPTPRTNQIVREQLARLGMTPSALAAKLTMHSEQLERLAAAWRKVAEKYRSLGNCDAIHDVIAQAIEANAAFDALREEVDG